MALTDRPEREAQAIIWDFYKPRHTHVWNMLVLSWRALEALPQDATLDFEDEYCWENYIIRLWLYRTTIKTLTRLSSVKSQAKLMLLTFDQAFCSEGQNSLKALRDMIEHFDDYAAGEGRGPGERNRDLDPWREVTRDRYKRGQFTIDRSGSYNAAINLRSDAKRVSDEFIAWYHSR